MKIYLAISCSILFLNLGCGAKNSTKKHEAPPAESLEGIGAKSDDADGQKGEDRSNPSSEEHSSKPMPGTPTCEDLWDRMVDRTYAGQFSAFETTSKSNYSGTDTVTVTKTRQEVVVVHRDAIRWKYHTEVNGSAYDSITDLHRSDFVENCGSTEDKPVEEGDEMVTVKAGTYQTHWAKYVFEKNGTKTTVKSWIHMVADGDSFVVKSESNSEGDTGTSSSVMELVERNG